MGITSSYLPSSPIMGSTSSLELNTLAADPSKLSYFSLPAEVRNQIMDYVLVPGDIYPCRPDLETSTRSPDTTVNVASHSGVQLIATCKQAHQEGHGLFYSSNTFHLPPIEIFEWSMRLQAKHKAMIKRISITVGLVELTPALLNKIENSKLVRVDQKNCWNGQRWGPAVLEALSNVWESKLRYIAAWTSLEQVDLSSFGRTYVLEHDEIVANKGHLSLWHQSPYWRNILQRAHICVFGNIMIMVDSVGWEKTKEWLYVRKPDEMAKGFWVGPED